MHFATRGSIITLCLDLHIYGHFLEGSEPLCVQRGSGIGEHDVFAVIADREPDRQPPFAH
jgi:hypothetical protein